MIKYKNEPKGIRQAVRELANHYYGSNYNDELFDHTKAKLDSKYLIFTALEYAKGNDLKALEVAFPARSAALKQFKQHMQTDPKQIVDEFFYNWGFMYDFDKKKVTDLLKAKAIRSESEFVTEF